MAEKYDEFLLPFLALMRKELHANAEKGDRAGWLTMTPNVCLLEIFYHVGKLQKAIKSTDHAGIVEFTADVANLNMMLLDIFGLLPQPNKTVDPAPTSEQIESLSALLWDALNTVSYDPLHPRFAEFKDPVADQVREFARYMLAGFPTGGGQVTTRLPDRHAMGQAASGWLYEHASEGLDWADSRHVDQLLEAMLGAEPDYPELNAQDITIDVHQLGPRHGFDTRLGTAVTIIHLPTGMRVRSHKERSQHSNKAVALKALTKLVHELG